jgi:cation transport ATPase
VIGRRDGDGGAPSAVLRELPLLVVLTVVVLGLALGAVVQWRLGALLVGGALALAALLRLVLPVRRSGLLVVRGRRLDVAVLMGLGSALLVLASSVPEP